MKPDEFGFRTYYRRTRQNHSFEKYSKFEFQTRHCTSRHSPVLFKNRQHYWQVCSRRAPFFQRPFPALPNHTRLKCQKKISRIVYSIFKSEGCKYFGSNSKSYESNNEWIISLTICSNGLSLQSKELQL